MRVIFVGVGEAFDEMLPNCSVLAQSTESGESRTLLLDCGFSAPFALWRIAQCPADPADPVSSPDPMDLDAVWISHFHGDHFFGLPALMLRYYEEKRTKPLLVVGQPGVEEKVLAAFDLAYPGTRAKFSYEMQFMEAEPGQEIAIPGFSLNCAPGEHPMPSLTVRVTDGKSSLFYSGDGRPTDASRALAKGVDLMVHESFSLEEDHPGHGTVPGSIAMAKEAGAGQLALVHIRRDVRHGRVAEIREHMQRAGAEDLEVLLPQPGDVLDI